MRKRSKQLVTLTLATLATTFLFQAQSIGQTAGEIDSAADKLREGHILRTFQSCKQRGGSDETCKQELGVLLQRDRAALARIASFSETADKTDLIVAAARCYDPSFDYAQLIECRETIADDLQARRSLATNNDTPTQPAIERQEPESEVRQSAQSTEIRPSTEDLVAVFPKRRPPRFADVDWVSFLGKSSSTAANNLAGLATCDARPLEIKLPRISNETSIRHNFWRPISGKLPEGGPEIDTSSGLNILRCDFPAIARANLMFHRDEDIVFRIDIFLQRNRCDDLNDATCIAETIEERANDIDLFFSAGEPRAVAKFGSSSEADAAYANRYANLLDDEDGNRRLAWSSCARPNAALVSAFEEVGLLRYCVVEAASQEGIWRSVSFLRLVDSESQNAGNIVHLASKMTFADESLERQMLDRHSIYFETLVAGRLVAAAKATEPEASSEAIQEVSVLQDSQLAKPDTDPQPEEFIDQRDRMRSVLRKLIGLAP